MSEGQTETHNASLTGRREPSEKDVDLLHQIIVRAQEQPDAPDQLRLFEAYEAVFKENGLDVSQDEVCFGVLFDLLKPGVQGQTLLERFEHVLRNKGIEIVFDDDVSMQDAGYSIHTTNPEDGEQIQQSRRPSEVSRQSSQDIADLTLDTDRRNLPGDVHQASNSTDEPSPEHILRLERIADMMNRRTLLRDSFGTLIDNMPQRHPMYSLRVMEDHSAYIYQRKLKTKVLTHWLSIQRQIVFNHEVARDFRARSQLLQSFGQLFDSARVNRLYAMEDERLRGLSLYKMAIASREAFLTRKVQDNLKRKVLRSFLNSVRHAESRNFKLQNCLHQVQARSTERLMHSTVTFLYNSSQQHYTIAQFAHQRFDNKLQLGPLMKMHKKSEHISKLHSMAQEVRKHFLMRKYFNKMREKTQFLQIRRTVLGGKYFRHWRKVVRDAKRKKLEEVCRSYRRAYKMRLATRCFRDLKEQVVTTTGMQDTASKILNAKIRSNAHAVLVMWYNTSQQAEQQGKLAVVVADKLGLKRSLRAMTNEARHVHHLQMVAQEFQHIHYQTVSTKCLRSLGRKVFEVRRRQQDAEAFCRRHERQMCRGRIDEWRRKAAESRGEGPLILPPATPGQRRVNQLNRLASTTPLYAPKTSFTARLRGERAGTFEGIEDIYENNGDDDGNEDINEPNK